MLFTCKRLLIGLTSAFEGVRLFFCMNFCVIDAAKASGYGGSFIVTNDAIDDLQLYITITHNCHAQS